MIIIIIIIIIISFFLEHNSNTSQHTPFINHKAKPILEYIEQKHVTNETKVKLSKICLKAIMKMVLLDNMLHGDLHPGL
jgi:uncharacterized protein YxeA